jgi:hypothetical protein
MRRLGSAALVLAALSGATGTLFSCRTDEPRRTSEDGGATMAGMIDGGGGHVVGGLGADAKTGALGAVGDDDVVSETVDAGHLADQAASTATSSSTAGGVTSGVTGAGDLARSGPKIGQPAPVAVDPIQVTIFNRVLAKAKTRDLNPGRVQELAESLTQQKVERARRTAGTFWLIQFAPTTPPRGKAEQERLVQQLKAGGDFEFVEPDQVLTVK